MRETLTVFVGLGIGVLVGLMGIGGGTVAVPAMVYLLGLDQHAAQGTSLFMQLPPLGLGALWVYWKNHRVDLPAGIVCALGFLPGGYAGGLIALAIPSRNLQGLFGLFLVLSAAMLWRQGRGGNQAPSPARDVDPSRIQAADARGARLAGILAMACIVGVASGLFGIGGGVLLVPLLVLLFGFEQHRAQGTSLVAMVPPTGAFAFLAYYRAHQVDMKVALLLIPGFVVGGILGGKIASKLPSRHMRVIFGAFLFVVGAWQAVSLWTK